MLRINPNVRVNWTPPEDLELPEGQRSVLVFRPLTGAKFLELCEYAHIHGETDLRWAGRDAGRIVAACLVGWIVPDGAPFPGPEVAVEQLDAPTLQAAALFILRETNLGEVTRKNSGSVPATSPAPSSTSAIPAPAPVVCTS